MFFKDLFISLRQLFHHSGRNLHTDRFLQTLFDPVILFSHTGTLLLHKVVCCHLQEAQILFSNSPSTPKLTDKP